MLGLWLTLVLAIGPGAEKVSTIVDFRGISAHEAFEKLGKALHARIVIGRQVQPELLERDIRLHTEHLSPDQSVRWVARLVGLEAVHTPEGYYIAPAAHLIQLGTPLQGTERNVLAVPTTTGPAETGSDVSREANRATSDLLARRGALFWQDTPLTRVAADVTRIFGVDLVIEEGLLSEESLLEWEQPDVSLSQVCQFLAAQLKAVVEFRDGALWMHPPEVDGANAASSPAALTHPPARKVEGQTETSPSQEAASDTAGRPDRLVRALGAISAPTAAPAHPDEPTASPQTRPSSLTTLPADSGAAVEGKTSRTLTKPDAGVGHLDELSSTSQESIGRAASRTIIPGRLTIDPAVRDWAAFARQLESASGWPCKLKDHGRRYQTMEVDGPAAEVLEALRLMGRLDYRVESSGENRGGAISLEILPTR